MAETGHSAPSVTFVGRLEVTVLPPHAHVTAQVSRNQPASWEATWSTPAGVWTLSVPDVRTIGPGLTRVSSVAVGGPGGQFTLTRPGVDQVVLALRGLGALPQLGDLAPPAGQREVVTSMPSVQTGVLPVTEALVFGSLLRPFLPDHTHTVGGARASGMFVLGGVIRRDWSAEWTNPGGRWSVRLNPCDPYYCGVVLTGPGGVWRFPGQPSHAGVVSVLRGLEAIAFTPSADTGSPPPAALPMAAQLRAAFDAYATEHGWADAARAARALANPDQMGEN